MRITKINIKSYRSCTETEFSPDPNLTVLIGPNGSGKTTVLLAIRLLSSLIDGFGRYRNGAENNSTPSQLKVAYETSSGKVVHTVQLDIVTNENNEDQIVKSTETWVIYLKSGKRRTISLPLALIHGIYGGGNSFAYPNYLGGFASIKKLDASLLSPILEVIEFLGKIKYYGASQFTNPSSCPISFEVEAEDQKRRGISISGHKRLLYDMYQLWRNRNNSNNFDEYLNIVGSNGIGLIKDISFREIETSTSKYSVKTGGKVEKIEKSNLLVIPSFSISGNSLSPSQLSEGTFKSLALIFYIVNDNSSLLLIEEPEVCVHHGLLNSIIELIKFYSRDKQILLSTHSESILDKLEVENVFSVKRDPINGTKVSSIIKRMERSQLSALRYYLNNEGGLGEYWRHGDLEIE